jgi:hypothetical protein
MNRPIRKLLAWTLALIMLIGMMPVDAVAAIIKTDTSNAVKIGDIVPMRIIQPETPTHTYNFEVNNVPVDTQIIKTGESIYEPAAPEPVDGQIFKGWYDGDVPLVFGPKTFTESKVHTIKAKFVPNHFVFFVNDDKVIATKQVENGTQTNDNDVNYVLTNPSEGFSHWSETPNGAVPFDFNQPITGATTLYLVTKTAYRVTFISHGGTSVLPVYVDAGGLAAEPAPPVRTGYDFRFWSTTNTADAAAFNFNTPINAPTTLHAIWQARDDVAYTVVYEIENANDDNYSFESASVYYGTAGQPIQLDQVPGALSTTHINPTYRQFFRYENGWTYDENAKIAPDGSTSVTVRFKRNSYKMTFVYARTSPRNQIWTGFDIWGNAIWQNVSRLPVVSVNNTTSSTIYSFTAKFESDISTKWPTASHVTTKPGSGNTSYSWYIVRGGNPVGNNASKRLVLTRDLITSPETNGAETTFTIQWQAELVTFTLEYYLQNPDGNGHSLSLDYSQDVEASPSITGWGAKEIDGFTHDQTVRDGRTFRLYYNRDKYNLEFFSGGSIVRTRELYFDSDISNQNWTPTDVPSNLQPPEDYEFMGWYTTSDGAPGSEFIWEDAKMPRGGLALYAKWVHKPVEVVYFKTISGDGQTTLNVPYGKSINQAILDGDITGLTYQIPDGMDSSNFNGWYRKDAAGKLIPYDLDEPVLLPVNLYPVFIGTPYQVTYDEGVGEGSPPEDSKNYAFGAKAALLGQGEITAPEGTVFIGWTIEGDTTGTVYYPGDEILVNRNITLIAQFENASENTRIVYNSNINPDSAANETRTYNVANNAIHEIIDNPFDREGYEFKGWNTAANGSGASYPVGTEVLVDKIDEDENVLYAQWARTKEPVEAKKTWENGPASHPNVWFKLYRQIEGGAVEEIPAAEAPIKELPNGTLSVTWNDQFTHDTNGNKYSYSVKEVNAAGEDFTPENYNKMEEGLEVTNTYESPETDENVVGIKSWAYPVGTEEPDTKPQIHFELWRKNDTAGAGEKVEGPIIVGADNSVDFGKQLKTDIYGVEYDYYIKEVDAGGNDWKPNGYTKVEDGLTVTNTYDGLGDEEPITVEATKTWVGIPDGGPYPSTKITLKQNGVTYKDPVALTATGNGSQPANWADLPKYAPDGQAYIYTVVEEAGDIPNGYDMSQEGLVITNAYTGGEKVKVEATKTWSGIPDGGPYPSTKITLKQNGDTYKAPVELTATGNGDQPAEWADLPKYAPDGQAYIYTVVEEAGDIPNGYDMSQEGLVITNAYTGGEKVKVEATKTWSGIPDGGPYPSTKITLKQNGDTYKAPVELTATGNGDQPAEWADLPKYAPDGEAYVYTVVEEAEDIPNGYEMSQAGLVITNAYTGGEKVKVEATKTWSGIPEGGPYPSTKITLKQNGDTYKAPVELTATGNGDQPAEWADLPKYAPDGEAYVYTVVEEAEDIPNGYEMSQEGLVITNTYTGGEKVKVEATKTWSGIPDGGPYPSTKITLKQNGDTYKAPVELTATGNGDQPAEWADLPKYAPDGEAYVYTVVEEAEDIPNGYEMSQAGLVITNAYTGGEKVKVEATKTWSGIPDGGPYPSTKITLKQNGDTYKAPVELTATGNGDQPAEWADLPKYAPDGEAYVYTVVEEAEDIPNGYEMSQAGLVITNAYTGGEKVKVEATKTWSGIPDGGPYPSTKITLKQNGDTYKAPVELTATGNGDQPAEWADLQSGRTLKYRSTRRRHPERLRDEPGGPDGQAYIYTVVEEAGDIPNGYDMSQEGLVITNAYTGGEKVKVEATKTWSGIPDGGPYPSTKITLKQNGDTYKAPVELTATGNGDQPAEWADLPKYAPDGEAYVYTVVEEAEDIPNGYEMSQAGLVITNAYTGGEKVKVEATKTWSGIPDGGPYPSTKITLKQNGVTYKDPVAADGDRQRRPACRVGGPSEVRARRRGIRLHGG